MTAGKKEKNRVVKRIVLEIPKPYTKSNVSNEIADYDVNEVKSEVQNNIADYEVNEAKHSIADNIMKDLIRIKLNLRRMI